MRYNVGSSHWTGRRADGAGRSWGGRRQTTIGPPGTREFWSELPQATRLDCPGEESMLHFVVIIVFLAMVKETIHKYLDYRLRMADRQLGTGDRNLLRAMEELR